MTKVKVIDAELNEAQTKAAQWDGSHVMILAGAGTGKTITIIARAEHLLSTGVDPNQIAMLTFTRRAAQEMKGRLTKRFKHVDTNLFAGTFHSFCMRWMRARAAEFKFSEQTLIDADDQVDLFKRARAKIAGREKGFPQASAIKNYYGRARSSCKSYAAYVKKYCGLTDAEQKVLVQVMQDYDQLKKGHNYFDYDDILERFANTLASNPKAADIVGKTYVEILVDEMQDTNPLQWKILNALKDHARLFLVGDDAQAIYTFRGADFKNMHLFKKRVPDGQVLKLEDNYRSTQAILDVSNWLIDQSPLNYDKRLKAARDRDIGKPVFMRFRSAEREAEWIAKDILERHDKGAEWRKHMVLFRSMKKANVIEATFKAHDIPYQVYGGQSLLQMAHIKDLFSMIRCSLNLRDTLAWTRYLTLFPGIGDVTAGRIIEKFLTVKDLHGAVQALKDECPSKWQELRKAPEIIAKNKNAPKVAVKALIEYFGQYWEKKYDHWQHRKLDMEMLASLAAKHDSMRDFLETYTLDPVYGTNVRPTEDDCVSISTIHSAKGTEAETCYIPACDPGHYPLSYSLHDKDDVEEERRVLYVALTRAMDNLILSSRGHETNWRGYYMTGGVVFDKDQPPIRFFLEDLPTEMIVSRADAVGDPIVSSIMKDDDLSGWLDE